MTNQFFYTRKEGDKEFTDSFNVNKVIRTVMLAEDDLLILLDDFHEITEEIPEINPKTNKVIRYRKQKNIVHSEITLNKSDAKRFLEKLSI